jgi:hypothetical protein
MSIQTTPEQQQEACLKSRNLGTIGSVSRWFRGAGSFFTESRLVELAVFFIFALYVRAVTFAPVYDDNVIGPPLTLRDLPTVFSHDLFYNADGNAHSVYYRPLATTCGMLVGTITGGAPGWFHLVAILMHMAVVVLAYVFGCQLFSDKRLALLTALLFGLHPSKVESVVWIGSSLVDGFGAIFFFASLITFLKWHESKYSRWLVASVGLFTCSLFVKETMVILPALLAVYLWLKTPSVGRFVRSAVTLVPYGVVWAIYMAIRHQVIKPAGPTVEYIHPTVTFVNLWNAPYSIWWYIGHLLMPWGLSVEYVTKGANGPTFSGFILPFVGLILPLTLSVWVWSRRRSSTVAFLAFWFLVALAPPVFFAPMVGQHDRYAYLSSYAFCALVAWAVLHLGTVSPRMRAVGVLSLVLIWSGLTWHEMGYWDCDKTLWGRVLEISPTHPKACVQLALIENVEGNVPEALRLLDVGLPPELRTILADESQYS